MLQRRTFSRFDSSSLATNLWCTWLELAVDEVIKYIKTGQDEKQTFDSVLISPDNVKNYTVLACANRICLLISKSINTLGVIIGNRLFLLNYSFSVDTRLASLRHPKLVKNFSCQEKLVDRGTEWTLNRGRNLTHDVYLYIPPEMTSVPAGA